MEKLKRNSSWTNCTNPEKDSTLSTAADLYATFVSPVAELIFVAGNSTIDGLPPNVFSIDCISNSLLSMEKECKSQ